MSAPVPVRVGQIIEIQERDYMYGVGPLTLRVTGIGHVVQLDSVPWVNGAGVEIRWDGSDGMGREVLVRLRAPRGAVRPRPASGASARAISTDDPTRLEQVRGR